MPLRPFVADFSHQHSENENVQFTPKLLVCVSTERFRVERTDQPGFFPRFDERRFARGVPGINLTLRHDPPSATAGSDQTYAIFPDGNRCRLSQPDWHGKTPRNWVGR